MAHLEPRKLDSPFFQLHGLWRIINLRHSFSTCKICRVITSISQRSERMKYNSTCSLYPAWLVVNAQEMLAIMELLSILKSMSVLNTFKMEIWQIKDRSLNPNLASILFFVNNTNQIWMTSCFSRLVHRQHTDAVSVDVVESNYF